MLNGLASSFVELDPLLKRSSMALLVGSASALNT